MPNDNTRVLMLESKKVDIIENPPGNLVKQINKTPGLSVQLFPSTRVDFIQLDQHFAPFKNLYVRQALNYAIDRNAIVKLAYQGHAIPGSSFMPYKMQYWNDRLTPYPYDPAKAKQLLAKGGYPHGFNTFLITVSGDVAGQAEAVVVKSELAKVGITVDIQSYELLTAYTKEDGGHSQMGERYWTNDIIDPDEVATFGADCKGGANAFNSYWCDNTEATKLVNQARAELNPAKRQQMYNQIQQIVYQRVAVPRHRLQPVPVRRRRLGARLPRHPARQLRPVPGDPHGAASTRNPPSPSPAARVPPRRRRPPGQGGISDGRPGT